MAPVSIRVSNNPFAMLTTLDNSVRGTHATSGECPISGRLAKCPSSSLWGGSADAYSGLKLAATPETTGKIECQIQFFNVCDFTCLPRAVLSSG